MISWFHLLKVLAFLAVCLHLSVCIRVSVHRCNAYVMSSTLLTAYRSLISLAMPSRSQSLGQSLSLSPRPMSNCELEHLQNARIALGTSHIREIPQMLSCYAFTLTLQLQLAAAAAVATMREPSSFTAAFSRPKQQQRGSPFASLPSPPLAACLLCDYYKLENNRLSP